MKIFTLTTFLLFLSSLFGYETTIISDEARYNGEMITLTGHVIVENSMGKVSADLAILKKDAEKKTKIDFPWIELRHHVKLDLPEGGSLYCETIFLDHIAMSGLISGNPQVIYRDEIGEVYADRARIDYRESEGKLEATKVTLFENVRLINFGSSEKTQYALADTLYYFPQEQFMLFEGNQNRVLFYDEAHDMQLSAHSIRVYRDKETHKESVQGIGDVRFIFGPEEINKIELLRNLSWVGK